MGLMYHWNAKSFKVVGNKVIFQCSLVLTLFAMHAAMIWARWLLGSKCCHLKNKGKGATLIGLSFGCPWFTTMGICYRFLGIAIGVFWRFNNEINGLGWLGCKNSFNLVCFHFIFVRTIILSFFALVWCIFHNGDGSLLSQLNPLYSWLTYMEVPTLKFKDFKFSSFDSFFISSNFP
jgi:hypothetical protein